MSNELLNKMILLWKQAQYMSGMSYLAMIAILAIIIVIFGFSLYHRKSSGGYKLVHPMVKGTIGVIILILFIAGFIVTSQNHSYDATKVHDFNKIKANRETAKQIPHEKFIENKDNYIYMVYNKRHSSNLAQIRRATRAKKRYLHISDTIDARKRFNAEHNHSQYPMWYNKI